MQVNQHTANTQDKKNLQDKDVNTDLNDLEMLRGRVRQLELENVRLLEEIKNWEEKYEEQERIHNREIVELKCNLDNSIFEDHNENDLQVIQEETEFYQKSFTQSQVTPCKLDGNNYQNIISILDQIDLEETIDFQQDQETYIVQKVKKLVEITKKMEMEVDDWKRNYWMLEKKFNNMILQQSDKLVKQGSEEIEIEYDFEKKKIITKKASQKTFKTLQNDDAQILVEEIKRLKQLNAELIQQQKHMTKQLLEHLISGQQKCDQKNLTQVSEPGLKQPIAIRHNNSQHVKVEPRNHYFSQYFQAHQQQLSMRTQKQLNNTQSDHSYDAFATPVLMKHSNASPFNRSNNKILQF